MGAVFIPIADGDATERGAVVRGDQLAGPRAAQSPSADDEAAFRALAEAAIAAHQAGERGPGCAIQAVHKLFSFASFAPMVLAGAIPDVRIAALVAACVAVVNFAVTAALRWAGAIRIWPKIFDIVNITIYSTVAVTAYTHPVFTTLWMPVLTNGLTAAYFLSSLAIKRPFTIELAKESAPQGMWDNPAFLRLMWRISAAWAAAITISAACALAWVLTALLSGPNGPAYLGLDVVMGIVPLLAAIVAQNLLTRTFKRRVAAMAKAIVEERGAVGAVAGADAENGGGSSGGGREAA